MYEGLKPNRNRKELKRSLFFLLLSGITSSFISCSFIGCSTMRSFFATDRGERAKPISNPFSEYRTGTGEGNQSMILRTKKGDRSVELEIPGDTQRLSDFVLPVSPAFKDTSRSIASDSSSGGIDDKSYRDRSPTFSDHEIIHSFPQSSPDNEGKRREIEAGLNLAPVDDDTPDEGTQSYLAAMDHIKQLYQSTRYEAALLETDDLIKQYPTDPKLYEMRGTLLDRMGRKELAIKSWSQALHFNPKNESLRRFLDRKNQTRQIAGSP